IEAALLEEHEGNVAVPPRVSSWLGDSFLRMMPAQLGTSDLLGYKTFQGSLKGGVRYIVVLCRASTGEILALIDASYLTALRTGATSGAATRSLAPAEPVTVGIIGSGLEAATNLAGVAAVTKVSSVRVFSRSAERRTAFAAQVSADLDVDVRPVDDPVAAVDG